MVFRILRIIIWETFFDGILIICQRVTYRVREMCVCESTLENGNCNALKNEWLISSVALSLAQTHVNIYYVHYIFFKAL